MSWRETNSPTTIPFWARCDNPFHLFVLTTFFTQVSFVTLGHRASRSSAFGLAEAELLSASSRPNGLPSRCACCVALTPLSKRHFFEVISCAVKGRTSIRSVHGVRTRICATSLGGPNMRGLGALQRMTARCSGTPSRGVSPLPSRTCVSCCISRSSTMSRFNAISVWCLWWTPNCTDVPCSGVPMWTRRTHRV